MKSATRGSDISVPEVTNVSGHGFWLLLGAAELSVSFKKFPWFRDATIRAITKVERPASHHLYWSDLDIDLAVESVRDPGRFPLVSRSGI